MNVAWPTKKLGELADISRGSSPRPIVDTRYSEGGTIPWVKIADATKSGKFLVETKEHVNEFGASFSKRLPAGTILVAASGTLGYTQILGVEACAHDGWLILQHLRGLDRDFAYYALTTKERHFFNSASGAAIQNINTDILRQTEIPFPSLPVQRRIASVLSAYDELIENNQRRIQILEEMARAVYREWFVRFRFPGHEQFPRVASPLGDIPQGWEVREMREVADVIDCLHSKKPAECPDAGGIFLQLNNIGEAGKLDMREQFRISAEDYALWTSRIELQAGDCVITNVGRVGAVAQIPEGVKAAPGRNMTAIRPRVGRLTPTYLIEYLLSSHMASEVAKKKDLGTIMDSLNVKGIIRLHVPCPPMEAILRFESIARPIRKRIEVLVGQIQNLRRTRDLLLPRLLSGHVEFISPPVRASDEFVT